MKYLHHRGIVNTEDRRVWAFLGDGEMDEPEALGAISIGEQPAVQARVLTLLGRIATALDDHPVAQGYFVEALKVWHDLEDIPGTLHTLVGLAELHASRGDGAQAMGLLRTVLAHHAAQQPDKDVAARLLERVATSSKAMAPLEAPNLQKIVTDILSL
jgi:hypothetical protein